MCKHYCIHIVLVLMPKHFIGKLNFKEAKSLALKHIGTRDLNSGSPKPPPLGCDALPAPEGAREPQGELTRK